MKKLVVHIQRQRFELESRGAEADAAVLETAREVTQQLETLRLRHKISDSARAATLAALLLALDAKKGDNNASGDLGAGAVAEVRGMEERIDAALARTAPVDSGAPESDA